MLISVARSLVTLFGLGYFTKAPGTIASIVGVILGGIILGLGNGHVYLILLIAIIGVIGTFCLKVSASSFDTKDPSEVVIDELIGQWVALWPLILLKFMLQGGFFVPKITLIYLGLEPFLRRQIDNFLGLIPLGWYYLLALFVLFILFRFFDIRKPFIIGRIDKRNTPTSVILDDVFAGLYAGVMFLTLIFLIYILF